MVFMAHSVNQEATEEKVDPNYEFVVDAEGRKALKKIRKVEDLKAQPVVTVTKKIVKRTKKKR